MPPCLPAGGAGVGTPPAAVGDAPPLVPAVALAPLAVVAAGLLPVVAVAPPPAEATVGAVVAVLLSLPPQAASRLVAPAAATSLSA